MKQHATTSSTMTTPEQRWGTVLRAEVHRLSSSRRIRIHTLVIGALGIATGVGVVSLVGLFDPEGATAAGTSLPTAIETAGGLVAVLLGLSVISTVTAEINDATVLSCLLLVPKRTRLITARAVASTSLATATGLASGLLVLALGAALTGGGGIGLGLCLAAVGVTVALTALLAFFTGTVIRQGAAAMMVAMAALFILPLAVSILQFTGPETLTQPAGIILQLLPGTAVAKSVSVSSAMSGNWIDILTGLGVLMAWNLALGAIALTRTRTEDPSS